MRVERVWPQIVVLLAAGAALQVALPHLSNSVGLVLSSAPVMLAGTYAAFGFLRLSRQTSGRRRTGWAAGALSATLLGASYFCYTAYPLLGLHPASPNPADLLSLGAAIAAVPALVLVSPAMPGASARVGYAIDVATVSGALFALAWQFTLAVDSGNLPTTTWLLFVATMAPELLGGALALLLLSRTAPGSTGNPMRLLACGLGVFALTPVLAVHNRTHDMPWYGGGAGAAYLIAALLIALASRSPAVPAADDTGRRDLGGLWPALPYLPTVLAIGEVTRVYQETGGLSPVLMWVLLASCTMAMMRQLLTLATIKKLVHTLDHQANHDSLTGLPNRAAFYAAAERALAKAGPGSGVALMLLDLDGFKQVNDTLGHAAGDALLISVARRCEAALRPADMVGRLGGDEFVVVLRDLPDADESLTVAGRLLKLIGEPMPVAGTTLRVRASIGLTDVTEPGHDVERLLQDADSALYAAKAAGKGTVRRHLTAAPARTPV